YLSGNRLLDSLTLLAHERAVDGGAILSTCNRTEFYVTGSDIREAAEGVADVVAGIQDDGAWDRYHYRLSGPDAIAHMFRVAAGMDSAILGEGQILGQFKTAHAEAKRAGAIDGVLDYLMRRAITTAKRIRTETAIGRRSVGFGQTAA